MNNLIKKIEITGFRSIEHVILEAHEINIFSGLNDVGKSNILKALNLFFNSQTDFLKPLKFDDDYNKVARAKAIRSSKGKQLIKIRVYLNPPNSYNILKDPNPIYLERQFDRFGGRNEKFPTFSKDENKKKAAITRLINKIKYIYIPALKGEDVLQYLLSLIGERELVSESNILSLNESIRIKTDDLKSILNSSGISIGTSFGLPTLLSDFWQKLSVNTLYEKLSELDSKIKGSNGDRALSPSQFSISLLNRGEGIKSKYIPPLLQWLDKNDRTKVFIWGIDEPENSLEFELSDRLARLYFNNYALENQIFLTSHSLAFINPPEDTKLFPKVYKVFQDELGATIFEDLDNLFENQNKIELYEELGILTAQKEFIEAYRKTMEERDKLKIEIRENSKPIIIVEGKTDKWILETAWTKNNTDLDCPFVIIPSGLYMNENESDGNADQVRKALEFISTIPKNQVIIGLFDNDAEGNKQFKGLHKKVFEEYKISIQLRKHKKEDSYALLLPVPEFREFFVDKDTINYRYFEIEHYFSDEVLKNSKLMGKKILGSDVFEIKDNFKKDFANKVVPKLKNDEFKNFTILFEHIKKIISKKN
jgi:AAA15 family ATPase/GTPase/5S rRNA maturation endonuclease (ribonuclease M5)